MSNVKKQAELDLKNFWENVNYYTNLFKHYKMEIFRHDRWGKNLLLTSAFDIARALNISPSLLFELEEDRNLNTQDDLAAAEEMLLNKIGVSAKEIDTVINVVNKLKKYKESKNG